jgi:hypothetical protein
MPYITTADREKFGGGGGEHFDSPMEHIAFIAENAGQLNYAITMILKHYLQKKGECYAVHNEIMGMLDCCGKEWYRKRVAKYEDIKEAQNGPV